MDKIQENSVKNMKKQNQNVFLQGPNQIRIDERQGIQLFTFSIDICNTERGTFLRKLKSVKIPGRSCANLWLNGINGARCAKLDVMLATLACDNAAERAKAFAMRYRVAREW